MACLCEYVSGRLSAITVTQAFASNLPASVLTGRGRIRPPRVEDGELKKMPRITSLSNDVQLYIPRERVWIYLDYFPSRYL